MKNLVTFLIITITLNCYSAVPVNWPWRGVSVESKFTDSTDIAYLRSCNINFIRIELLTGKRMKREKCTAKQALKKELKWCTSLLNAAAKNKITCLIAFNYLIADSSLGYDDKSFTFWNNSATQDSIFRLVEQISLLYKDRGNELSSYEVMGEPVLRILTKSIAPPQLESFYRQALKHIRKYDKKRYFLLTPGPWARPTNYKGFTPYRIPDEKIIYNAHMYLPHAFTHQGIQGFKNNVVYPGLIDGKYWDKKQIQESFAALIRFEKVHHTLIYIGEYSVVRWAVGCDQWLSDVTGVINDYGWSWSYFAFECDTYFWDPFNEPLIPGNKKLLRTGDTSKTWSMLRGYYLKNKFYR